MDQRTQCTIDPLDLRDNERVVQELSRPSIALIKEICQPIEIRGRQSSEHWLNEVYLRKLSPYLTKALIPTGISANGVTILMILCGVLAATSILIPNINIAILPFLFGQFQMLLDCSDGEIARWRGTTSPLGVFLDKVGHYVTEALIPICIGVYVMNANHGEIQYLVYGLAASLLVILNKSLNDMVHVARAFSGLSRLPEDSTTNTPNVGFLKLLRNFARIIPLHRIFHSVEMTALFFMSTMVTFAFAEFDATKFLLIAMVVCATITVPGHFAAIVTSHRLKSVT